MPIDYSAWNNIEVSDDEDDTHPNVDTASLFRWRHQARVEREAEMKQAKKEVKEEQSNVRNKMQEIEEKLKSAKLEEKERISLELELNTIRTQEEEFRKKEKELEEKEKHQPWNVDTIAKEAWSKTIVNKPKEGTTSKSDEDEEINRMQKYFKDNETLLHQLCVLDGFDKIEEFLLEHPQLASEYATNFLTVEALNYAIDANEINMGRIAENCIMIQYELELAKSLHAMATNTNVIKNFFKKIRIAEQSYMKMFTDEVEAFKDRLRKRARDKREAMLSETEAEEKKKRVAQSPGGLDPQEVFDSLPAEMQEAFETQSMAKIFEVAKSMDSEVFKYHLDRCTASGLWIPNAKEAEGHGQEEEEEEKETEEK
ncbi:hypothetical protein niasHS_013241 [Heterodera schachtii]|uniref:Hsp90 chaperone protein kinase-targeting subunit n=1 Tax=Heterodera schachtii TaxID=97005 RepID=A0ABD2IGY3_HETSC